MMKPSGRPAGEDFVDNRVPGGDKRFGMSLTAEPELDNQVSMIMTHGDRGLRNLDVFDVALNHTGTPRK